MPTPVRILYVEDSDEVREVVAELMEAPGRDIAACADGEAADALDRAGAFDVVITDVGLPGMSGTELARRLLARDPQRFVALSTGYALDRGLDALGPNVRAMPKPFDDADLDRLLADWQAARDGRRD